MLNSSDSKEAHDYPLGSGSGLEKGTPLIPYTRKRKEHLFSDDEGGSLWLWQSSHHSKVGYGFTNTVESPLFVSGKDESGMGKEDDGADNEGVLVAMGSTLVMSDCQRVMGYNAYTSMKGQLPNYVSAFSCGIRLPLLPTLPEASGKKSGIEEPGSWKLRYLFQVSFLTFGPTGFFNLHLRLINIEMENEDQETLGAIETMTCSPYILIDSSLPNNVSASS
ncbi:hypothetical protein QYF36_013429 [Acer negundo]|nr:hypothetical protein QYF36_013429 [Acer negundo]